MINNIVELLREGICGDPCRVRDSASGCWCAEAADEIQRLRHDVSKAMMNHIADVNALLSQREALALLRELNDALVIPGWLQPRVDAVLDRAEGKR